MISIWLLLFFFFHRLTVEGRLFRGVIGGRSSGLSSLASELGGFLAIALDLGLEQLAKTAIL